MEIDQDTGATTVTRFVVVEDAGRLINPMIVDGQIRGGVTQGIANALFEEVVYDDDGNILTASLMDYLPPTAAEIPDIEIRHLETITDATITGAKGLGEGGTIGAPAAVLNAISDALAHLDLAIDEMPATPERVRALIRTKEALLRTKGGWPMSLERRPLSLTVKRRTAPSAGGAPTDPRRHASRRLRPDGHPPGM